MIGELALVALLSAVFPETAPAPPTLEFDGCANLEQAEVRRLVAMETTASAATSVRHPVEIIVGCAGGTQQLRLVDPAHRTVELRSIDLAAPAEGDREARTRELALAIAELYRRSQADVPDTVPPTASTNVPAARADVPRGASTAASTLVTSEFPAPPGRPSPHRGPEVAFVLVVDRWAAGQTLFGPDVAGRVHFSPRFVGELRVGGRRTQAIDVADSTVGAYGIGGSAALGIDLMPRAQAAGCVLGVRGGAHWLHYRAMGGGAAIQSGGDALGVYGAAYLSASVAIGHRIALAVEAATGGALHPVSVHESGRSISALAGLLISGGFGFVVRL